MVELFLVIAPLLLIVSLAGYGAVFGRVFAGEPEDFFEFAFAGIFLLTAATLTLNFFFGVGSDPGLFVVGTGLVLFAIFRGARDFSRIVSAVFVTFLTSLAFLLRSHTDLPVDAGLYYLSAMNWVAHQAAPLGLANLEGRLGFDSAWLVLESALRAKSLLGWSHLAIAEIALRSLALGWILQNFCNERAAGENRKAALYLISFVVLLGYLLIRAPSPTTTDLPANLLAFCAWLVFCRLTLLDGRDWPANGGASFALLVMLSVLAVTYKLAVLPIVLLPLFVVASRRELRGGLFFPYRVVLVCLLYGGLWLARNFMLSGCLVFPVDASCFSVPWNVGTDAHSLTLVVRGWARQPGAGSMEYTSLFDMRWVPVWFADFRKSVELYLVGAAAFVALLLFVFKPRPRENLLPGVRQLTWVSLISAAAGLLLWFFTAPNPRFSWCFFAIVAATLVFRALCQFEPALPWISQVRMTGKQAILCSLLLGLVTAAIQIHRGAGRIDAPAVPFTTVAAAQDWQIAVPTAGDQCWDLFPCTPYGFGGKSVRPHYGRLEFRADARPSRP